MLFRDAASTFIRHCQTIRKLSPHTIRAYDIYNCTYAEDQRAGRPTARSLRRITRIVGWSLSPAARAQFGWACIFTRLEAGCY